MALFNVFCLLYSSVAFFTILTFRFANKPCATKGQVSLDCENKLKRLYILRTSLPAVTSWLLTRKLICSLLCGVHLMFAPRWPSGKPLWPDTHAPWCRLSSLTRRLDSSLSAVTKLALVTPQWRFKKGCRNPYLILMYIGLCFEMKPQQFKLHSLVMKEFAEHSLYLRLSGCSCLSKDQS